MQLVAQVTGTVRWRESVSAMAGAGVDKFVEIGAGKVLSGLIRRIAPAEGVIDEDPLARPQQEQVRVRADLLDRLVNHAGEVAIYRSRLEQQLGAFRGAMGELERYGNDPQGFRDKIDSEMQATQRGRTA